MVDDVSCVAFVCCAGQHLQGPTIRNTYCNIGVCDDLCPKLQPSGLATLSRCQQRPDGRRSHPPTLLLLTEHRACSKGHFNCLSLAQWYCRWAALLSLTYFVF
eukprot:3076491-Amphidinium_carterae.1